MECATRLWTRNVFHRASLKSSKVSASITMLLLLLTVLLPHSSSVMVGSDIDDGGGPDSDKVPENHISQVRYRTRPVAAFSSGSSNSKYSDNATTSDANSSNETRDGDPSGPPFFAVHDLSSQTFEKLQENWKHVETFLRTLQARRSQDESQRSSQGGGGSVAAVGSDNQRRTPSLNNNVFTFRYHPVVLEGEGSRDVDDIIRGGIPPRGFSGGNHYGPYPFDPSSKDHQGGKPSDMERHTVATIYTIGICLTIMAIGSVMFILINKCDGTSGSSYARTTAALHGVSGSRIARSALGVGAGGGRQQNGRSRDGGGRQGPSIRNSNNLGVNEHVLASSANIPSSANSMFESDAKILTDLPPSYDELFPDSPLNLNQIVENQPSAVITTDNDIVSGTVTNNEDNNNTQSEGRGLAASASAPPAGS